MSPEMIVTHKMIETMKGILWAGSLLFVLLLLVCLCVPSSITRHGGVRRCPRTNAEANRKAVIGFGGRCYEVFTCTEACGASLQKLAESSQEAFSDKYQVEQATVEGAAGIHLSHHISKQRAQFAMETSCS